MIKFCDLDPIMSQSDYLTFQNFNRFICEDWILNDEELLSLLIFLLFIIILKSSVLAKKKKNAKIKHLRWSDWRYLLNKAK